MRTNTQFEEAAADLLTDEDYILGEVSPPIDGAGVYVTARIFIRYTDEEVAEVTA